jgi:hypothetical protein
MACRKRKEMSYMQTYFDWFIECEKRKLNQINPHWVKRKWEEEEKNRNIYAFFFKSINFYINKSKEIFYWLVKKKSFAWSPDVYKINCTV